MRQRKTVLVILTTVLISSISLAGSSHSSDYKVIQNQTGRLTPEEARKLKSPIPFSKESISRGRAVFARIVRVPRHKPR
jgi:hypothetical protein